MPKSDVRAPSGTLLGNTYGNMRGIPFNFFARIVLLTASFVLAVLSLTTRMTGKELVFAAASIAVAMLTGMFRRKRNHTHRHRHGSIPAHTMRPH